MIAQRHNAAGSNERDGDITKGEPSAEANPVMFSNTGKDVDAKALFFSRPHTFMTIAPCDSSMAVARYAVQMPAKSSRVLRSPDCGRCPEPGCLS